MRQHYLEWKCVGVVCPNLKHKFSDKLENRCWMFRIFSLSLHIPFVFYHFLVFIATYRTNKHFYCVCAFYAVCCIVFVAFSFWILCVFDVTNRRWSVTKAKDKIQMKITSAYTYKIYTESVFTFWKHKAKKQKPNPNSTESKVYILIQYTHVYKHKQK